MSRVFNDLFYEIKYKRYENILRIFNDNEGKNDFISRDCMKENLFHAAAYSNDLKCMNIVLENIKKKIRKESFVKYINEENKIGKTPLDIINEYINNSIKIKKRLIENGAKYEEQKIGANCNKNFLPPLHFACLHNKIEIVKDILENKNVDIDEKSNQDFTALYYAFLSGNNEIVKLLLKKNANCNIRLPNNELLIDFAKNKQKEKTLEKFIDLLEGKKTITIKIPRNTIVKRDIKIIELKKNLQSNKIEEYVENIDSEKNSRSLIKIKPKGLENIGGTCYMNTVLQCFYHVKELTEFFLSENETRFNNKSCCKSYLSVVKGLTDNIRQSSFKPTEFKEYLISINPGYKYNCGCDPKDVVTDFLTEMHQELAGPEASIDLNNNIDKRNKKKLFNYFKDQEEKKDCYTKISELFNYCIEFEKECLNCHTKVYDFQYENMCFFYLEKIYRENNFNSLELDLEDDCLYHMFKEKSYATSCNFCKQTRTNKVKISTKICVLPKYFIIINDRGKNDNFKCYLTFPDKMSLSQYSDKIDVKNEGNYNTKYDFICSTFLIKNSKNALGHTIALCKHFDNKYYLFNDNEVKEVNLNEIKSQYKTPFLLFYKRCEN